MVFQLNVHLVFLQGVNVIWRHSRPTVKKNENLKDDEHNKDKMIQSEITSDA